MWSVASSFPYFIFKASLEVRKFCFCFTDSKGDKTSKGKKKNRRRKDQLKNASVEESIETHEKVWTIMWLNLDFSPWMIIETWYAYSSELLRVIIFFFTCIRIRMVLILNAMVLKLTSYGPILVGHQNCQMRKMRLFRIRLSLMMVISMMRLTLHWRRKLIGELDRFSGYWICLLLINSEDISFIFLASGAPNCDCTIFFQHMKKECGAEMGVIGLSMYFLTVFLVYFSVG